MTDYKHLLKKHFEILSHILVKTKMYGGKINGKKNIQCINMFEFLFFSVFIAYRIVIETISLTNFLNSENVNIFYSITRV